LHFTALHSGLKLSEVLALNTAVLREIAATSTLEPRPLQLAFLPVEVTTDVNDPARANIQLFQNQPNPFAERTTIGFVLPEACEAELRVLDMNGRLLKSHRADFASGIHYLTFELGDETATGLLYYELVTPFGKLSKKMVITGK
jgi:hypothetical protein